MKFKKRIKKIWYDSGVLFFRLFFKLFYKVCIYGKENVPGQGPVLFVCNHQSYFDPILCGITVGRELHYLARNTLFNNRIMDWLLHSVNVIPIRRGEANLSAMKKVIGKLKSGCGVCLFPEATRSRDGKISVFKPGFGLLCRRSGACIIPVVIDGAFESWPRDRKLFSVWKKISVCYGESITVEQMGEMDNGELADRLTQTLRQIQKECRLKAGKEPYTYSFCQRIDSALEDEQD